MANYPSPWDGHDSYHYALEYMSLGWCPIPLDGKKPRNKWKLYQTRFPTMTQCKVWWDKDQGNHVPNIGIVTGHVSKLAIVDVDGTEGIESLKQAGITLPDTVTVETGRGRHYYYRYPEGGLKTCAGILVHIDIRAEGGLVAAPPSIHPETGKTYRFAEGRAPGEIELAEFPQELINAKKPIQPQEKILDSVLEGVPEGKRDDMIFRYACRLKGKG